MSRAFQTVMRSLLLAVVAVLSLGGCQGEPTAETDEGASAQTESEQERKDAEELVGRWGVWATYKSVELVLEEDGLGKIVREPGADGEYDGVPLEDPFLWRIEDGRLLFDHREGAVPREVQAANIQPMDIVRDIDGAVVALSGHFPDSSLTVYERIDDLEEEEGRGFVLIADVYQDQAQESWSVLAKSGIPCQVDASDVAGLSVRKRDVNRATRLLRKDSQEKGYWIEFSDSQD